MGNLDGNEKDINLEAQLLFHAISLLALEEVVSKIGDAVLSFPDNKYKSTADLLKKIRAKNIPNIMRHLADLDASRASRIQAILEEMNK